MAEDHDDPKSPKRRPDHDRRERPDAKARFARAIAQAEFGRFYWNEASDQALRAAMRRKPKR